MALNAHVPTNTVDMNDVQMSVISKLHQLRKWQDEKVKQLHAMQEKQWLQLKEGQKSVGMFTSLHDCGSKNMEHEYIPDTTSCRESSTYEIQNFTSALSMEEFLNNSQQATNGNDPHKLMDEDDDVISPGISGNVQSFEELIEQQMQNHQVEVMEIKNKEKVAPKRPFLKKGSGLSRFLCKPISYPKPKSCSNKNENRSFMQVQKKLQLLPQKSQQKKNERGIIKNSKKVHFQEGDVKVSDKSEVTHDFHHNSLPKDKFVRRDCNENSDQRNSSFDSSLKNDEEAMKQREHQDLFVFEVLEKLSENCSFSSDSSVVQKVLKKEALEPSDVMKLQAQSVASQKNKENNMYLGNKEKMSEDFKKHAGLHDISEAVKSCKQLMEKTDNLIFFDLQPELMTLEEPFSCSNASMGSVLHEPDTVDAENLSLSSDEKMSPSSTRNSETTNYLQNVAIDSLSVLSDEDQAETIESDSCGTSISDFDFSSAVASCTHDVMATSPTEKYNTDISEDEQNAEISKDKDDSYIKGIEYSEEDPLASGKWKIREKINELEEEINIFRKKNSDLNSLQKQREEALEKLEKDRKEFEKSREIELKRIEKELEEERKQFRRQKQTFERYQKLKKDFPGKKEREEITMLRHEVEKLREEMKKQEIKWNSDCRRLRNQLTAAEKERDCLRLENQRTEEQRVDLLALLKEKQRKCNSDLLPKSSLKPTPLHYPNKARSIGPTQEKTLKTHISRNANVEILMQNKLENQHTKLRCFSRSPSGDSLDTIEERKDDSDTEEECTVPSVPQVNRVRFNFEDQEYPTCKLESEYQEKQYTDRVERIYKNGEIDTLFSSGTYKHVSADGLHTTFSYYNGDVKEIFPDQRIVYKYAEDGTVQTIYPDGLDVIEHSNGQVERSYPDGMKHVTYVDGTQYIVSADSSEEIQIPEGTIIKLSVDGTETIQFANGEKEIRTAEFKRHEYQDGTVKTVYKSGRQETRFASGRIRIKDVRGNVIVDTKHFGAEKTPVRLQQYS